MKDVLAFVLGGGRGARLQPLTRFRSKPAVPLAGKYRLIDIPISNSLNSNINRIYVLTQFLSVSLHRHIRQTYKFDRFSGGFVEILAAQQTSGAADKDWYQGTADAVRKNLRYIDQPGVKYVLVLSGDQLYRMDYQQMIKTHVDSGADATIACLPVDREAASGFGIMRVSKKGKVEGFLEKPGADDDLSEFETDPSWVAAQGVNSQGRAYLASMGIYLFNREILVRALETTSYEDFGREIFPAIVRSRHVQAHLYDGYWEDIGTIRAFYEANLALAGTSPPFELARPDAPIFTRARFLPPSRLDGAHVSGSLVADGCLIGKGVTIENSVIGLRCIIGDNVTIRNSVIMGADEYESDGVFPKAEEEGRPPIGIGNGSTIDGAIVDKDCRIGQHVVITNKSADAERDVSEYCVIHDGIPVIVKNATLQDGWQLGADS
jgi:glucose-1-phosphate adenylyltransferase